MLLLHFTLVFTVKVSQGTQATTWHIKQQWVLMGERPPGHTLSLSLQDEQQQEMAASAAFIDQHYGHLIDTVLVRQDLQSVCSQLRAVIESLSKDTYWVPISWVR